MANTFLQAEWRKLIMANYAVDKNLLLPYLPYQTELDIWNNTCYVSIVGFMFQKTKVKGIKIPFHGNFEELNLRFYVRYQENGIWKRGAVFIKEIVNKPLLTFVANALYKEKYETMPTQHNWQLEKDNFTIAYSCKKTNWNSIKIKTGTKLMPILPNSEEEFITEHYWGYTKINETVTAEYGVEHPRWEIYETFNYEIDFDFKDLYGEEFGFLSKEIPLSVFLAEGSAIKVKDGRKI